MKRFLVVGAAALFAFVLVAADASAATLYSQSNVLRNEDFSGGVPCGGPSRGTLQDSRRPARVGNSPTQCQQRQGAVHLKGAAPGSYEVFWTCTTGARGCHNQACGFVSLGFVGVPGTGKAKFTDDHREQPVLHWLTGSPRFVHLDLIGPDLLASVYAGIPIGVGPAVGTTAAQAGDPTSR